MSATTNYKYPNTAAPSVGTYNMVVAEVVFTDLDTGGTITHNFGASGLSPSGDLTSDFPLVIANWKTAPTTQGVNTPFAVALTDSNTVTITKVAAVGSLGTVLVQILRPHTFIR